MHRGLTFLFPLLLLIFALPANAIKRQKMSLLRRIHTYAATIDTFNVSSRVSYAYSRAALRIDKRNAVLKLVPSAYVISRGQQREFLSESYSKIKITGLDEYTIEPLLRFTTIPHKRRVITNFNKYLTPDIYGETIIGNSILSPFHPHNFRFYKYHLTVMHGDTVQITFRPRRRNTQLVRGSALVDQLTGRIIRTDYRGEFDMVSFWVSHDMNEHGYVSLFPRKCESLMTFHFMGNRVSCYYKAFYGLPQVLPDTIAGSNDFRLIEKVRPDTLNDMELGIYNKMREKRINDSIKAQQDTVKKKHWAKSVFWDAIGDNVLNRVKTNFGMNNRGYIRLNPVLNPLYMGYDHRRGFTYKIDLRGSYQLGSNSEISGRFKGGYAFKQKQFYFRLPIYYYFDRSHNRYVKLEVGNGNHISNESVRKDIEQTSLDLPAIIDLDLLNEFKQTDARLMLNYDISSLIGFQVGALYQHKKAVNAQVFHSLHWESTYSSFAPILELQIRPWGWSGPIFSADYDRAIKGVFETNIDYERWEFNGEYIHHINRLQSMQMRAGGGFYTMKGRQAYFLNYENFQDNNIPGGWNDDWSGEFELLRSDTYNTSEYYLRANFTYESPLLFLSWLPLVGHYMEMERIYVSVLDARRCHPYIELGYGFTTRWLSMGVFASNGRGNRSFGCKFGFELFRHW